MESAPKRSWPLLGNIAVWSERCVFPLVFFYFAWNNLTALEALCARLAPGAVDESMVGARDGLTELVLVPHFMMLFFNLFMGFMLLLGRPPAKRPQEPRDIIVPLVNVGFSLAYNYSSISWVPDGLKLNLLPATLQFPFALAGLVLLVLGPALGIWAMCYMRRNFSIFVMVRGVVLGGPYRFVRHPMYLGYLLMCLGIMLSQFSIGVFLLVPIHFTLFYHRARMEEARLAEHSPAYREHQRHSGFLLPRWR